VVIAVLMGILMPSLRLAREQARLVSCASNQKQLLLGLTGYATENEDKLPPSPVKLIKIGAKVIRHSRYVVFQMAEVVVPRDLFSTILARIG